jgi:hypothetical protein
MKPTGCIDSCYCSSLDKAANTTADGMKVKNRFHSTVVTKHLEGGNGIFVDLTICGSGIPSDFQQST